jgi:hypothetical protein
MVCRAHILNGTFVPNANFADVAIMGVIEDIFHLLCPEV